MAGDATRNRNKNEEKLNVKLKSVEPKTNNQKIAFQEFQSNKNLFLHGSAGTGKSFISLYLSLKNLYEKKDYEKIVIIRSAVSTRDQGFLPGDVREKEEIYKLPYISIVSELCTIQNSLGSVYYHLEKSGVIQFMTTSYIRGINLNNCIVIVDECQNMTWHEYYSVMTRLGENCRIIFSGDTKQNDFKNAKKKEESGIETMMGVCEELREFSIVKFTTDDIVRSGLVKKFIEICEKRNL
jgi:phosphate starvation-inducible protein PhoH and related proteins